MAIVYDTNRYKTKSPKNNKISKDNTLNKENNTVHTITMKTHLQNKTRTLMKTQK